MPPDDRMVQNPMPMPEIVTDPVTPKRLGLVDSLLQGVFMLVGMFRGVRRLLKVDPADRLLVCNTADEANRITESRYLAAALPATVIFQADTIGWTVVTTAGGVEVDPQDAAAVSYGMFTIQTQGVWPMHVMPAQVVLTPSVWTLAAASHVSIIEWRRM